MFIAPSKPSRTKISAVIWRVRVCSDTWYPMKVLSNRAPDALPTRSITPWCCFGIILGDQNKYASNTNGPPLNSMCFFSNVCSSRPINISGFVTADFVLGRFRNKMGRDNFIPSMNTLNFAPGAPFGVLSSRAERALCVFFKLSGFACPRFRFSSSKKRN